MNTVTIGTKEYAIIDEITSNDIKYIYLANVKNPKDVCVRKEVKEELLPLDDEKEFKKSMLLFVKKNKEEIKDLLNE